MITPKAIYDFRQEQYNEKYSTALGSENWIARNRLHIEQFRSIADKMEEKLESLSVSDIQNARRTILEMCVHLHYGLNDLLTTYGCVNGNNGEYEKIAQRILSEDAQYLQKDIVSDEDHEEIEENWDELDF